MMLITREIACKLVAADKRVINGGEDAETDEIIVHFFNPAGAGDWYIVSGTPLGTINGEPDYETDNPADWHLFGYCDLGLGPQCSELGYVLLSQLKEIKGLFGLGIEREYHYRGSLKEVMAKAA